jgi:sigma-B regulation protein RsbU (phosphoserine phosphatase)
MVLGATRSASYERATVAFEPGDVLVAFTDGLVERPGHNPDDGLAEVIDIVTSALAAAPGGPLAEILARLRQANPDDDTCILAARPTR